MFGTPPSKKSRSGLALPVHPVLLSIIGAVALTRFCLSVFHRQDKSGRPVLPQSVSGAGRVHQRVAVVRRRGTLSVGLRRVVRVLRAPVVHAPGVQRGVDRGHRHRGRVVGPDGAVVPAVPVGHRGPGRLVRGKGIVRDRGHHGGRLRRGLLT